MSQLLGKKLDTVSRFRIGVRHRIPFWEKGVSHLVGTLLGHVERKGNLEGYVAEYPFTRVDSFYVS